MTEQEAIISHIEECKHRISVIQEFVETNKDANVKKCERNIFVLNNAIKTLEKQISKKPRMIRSEIYDGIIHYYCPNCGRRFGERGEHNVIMFKKELYCQGEECGQKLDWGNEDAE